MHTVHSTLSLNSHALHIITFDPATFEAGDLLWLPHHALLAHAGRKRKSEHLAGRIAAVHALSACGYQCVPDIGEKGEPRWPAGLYGSISHCDSTAVAVVSHTPIGVDRETCLAPSLCAELAGSIVNAEEYELLQRVSLPFPLALTIVFSAKESLFKAFSAAATPFPGFHSAQVIALNSQSLTLRICAKFCGELAGMCVDIAWIANENQVTTLVSDIPSGFGKVE